MSVYDCIRSYETLYSTVHKVHSTSVHIRFQTIAIRLMRFKYESYMVKYGQTQSSTGIHGLNVYQSFLILNSIIMSPVASAIVIL